MNEAQLDGAETIFAMEQKHLVAIKTAFGNKYFNKTRVLHIKDTYKYGSKELIAVLEFKIPSL